MVLFGKRVFADGIKDFEMRSPWVIWVGPKSNDQCPYEGRQRQKKIHRDTGKRPCKDEDRGGRDAATSQGTVSHQECEEVRKVLPQTFRGMWLCNPIDFRLLASRTVPK